MALVDYSAESPVWSYYARNLKNSILAEMFQKFNLTQDAIVLHAGLPPSGSFPLSSVTATTPFTSTHILTGGEDQQTDSKAAMPLDLARAQQSPVMQVQLAGQLMSDAQQYMFHAGHPPLLRWVRDMAASLHRPPNPVDCVMSSGAVDALTAAVSCLLDPGDYIVCEEFTYPHAPQCAFVPRRLNMLPVAMDEQGMLPDSLRHVLSSTPPSPVTGCRPKVIYLIPSGQNPTGAVMTVERKREIYEICRQYNLIIIEDDAYYWLQYPKGSSVPEAGQPGLQLPSSFLSMDTDSRVLRIDTFSKLLGPGFRLGWVTGAPKLVSKVGHAIQAGTCGPSSLSQVVVSQLLEGWGTQGFEAFIKQQQALYAKRADAVVAAARRHLTGLATWQDPRAGMFMWFKLACMEDMDSRVLSQLVEQRVAVIPGRAFWTDTAAAENTDRPCPYFRVAFSCVPEDRIDEAFARLGAAIRAAVTAAPTADSVASDAASDACGASDADATTLVSDSCPSPTLVALIGGAAGGATAVPSRDADVEGVVTLRAAAAAALAKAQSGSLRPVGSAASLNGEAGGLDGGCRGD